MTHDHDSLSTQEQTSALQGIRVIDFGHYIAGPLAGMLLADQGAEVIKVERPGGDPARACAAFATWNRGKQSVQLDLQSPNGRAQAQALVRTADVVIENFRPGVAERLGIGYETLAAQQPGLIYCSMPGFGPGHALRHEPGWEPIIGASTGLYPALHHTGGGASAEPLFTPLPIASTYAAMLGAVSIAMALNARGQTGRGQRIEVPLHSAMFTAMGRHLVKFETFHASDNFAWPRHVMARQYQCADGRYVQHHGMFRRFLQQTLTAANRTEWLEEATSLFERDVDAATLALWEERFRQMFRQRTAQEWEEAISAAGGACTVCKTIDEWLVHPHAVSAGMVVEVEDAHYGPMKQPGVQVKLRRIPGRIQGRAPLLGEHTRTVLETLGTAASAPLAAASDTPGSTILGALAGVRVLDLCIILAGPTCGRTLAEFGADVIKIDDPTRPGDPVGYIDVNRGKRSIELNLKTEEGRTIFWRLVDTADVIVENNRYGSLERLGLGYEAVRARKPSVIYASLNCYGYDGPWRARPGWEQLAQATSGIQVRRGGRDGAPLLLPYAVNDYGTGLMGAYAVALALYERQRSGQGQAVDSGLALTAGLLQSPFFLDYAGFQRCEPEGLEVRGWSAASRLYATADGWIYVHCADAAAWQRLLSLPAFAAAQHYAGQYADPFSNGHTDTHIAKELGSIFGDASSAHWVQTLRPHGISVVPNMTIADFRYDPYVRQAGLIITRQHPERGNVDHLGTPAHLSGTPMHLGAPTPVPGGQTREILHEIGYSATQIAHYIASGAVRATVSQAAAGIS
jgi:crotonobetainyl-CoA:carnitine CoA-transferase CaiB-like acyl-CoA transferase